ncbi:efflux RND transporter periplasmic adaptor subunit [Chitinimonas lacunae]|uniref:Efflux RND transporter periplasmic adaptor subunit n=1 Tax=Chitinimonas lacunae TaxID=1963018 RepID=A0ABV8MIY4_9NEIS
MRFPFKRKWLVLAIALGVVAVPLALGSKSGDSALAVQVEAVTQRDIRPTILASGTLAYRAEVELRSELTARVQQVLVVEGDTVSKGQVLLKLDPESYRNAIDREEAALKQSRLTIERERASLELQRKQFERTQKLFEAKMIDGSKFDDARNQLRLAEVALRSSEEAQKRADAVLREAREQLGKTEIRSPISGRVVALPIKAGETAIPSVASQAGAQLMTIADVNGLQAELKVDEADIARIAVGQKVEVFAAAYPEQAIPGRVTKLALTPTVSNSARAYKVTVDLQPGPGLNLRSGMSCRAEVFLSDGQKKLAVPVEAVLSEEATNPKQPRKRYVVVERNGRATRVDITLGIADDRWQEVSQGLKAGDRLIIGPGRSLQKLKTGDPIKPQSTPVHEEEELVISRNAPGASLA